MNLFIVSHVLVILTLTFNVTGMSLMLIVCMKNYIKVGLEKYRRLIPEDFSDNTFYFKQIRFIKDDLNYWYRRFFLLFFKYEEEKSYKFH